MANGLSIFIHVIAVIIILIIIGILIWFVYQYSTCDEQRRDCEAQLEECIKDLQQFENLPIPLTAFVNKFSTASNFNDGIYLTFDASAKTVLTADTTGNVIMQARGTNNTNQLWKLKLVSNNLVISTSDGTKYWTTPADFESSDLITLTTSDTSQYQLDDDVNNQSYLSPFLLQELQVQEDCESCTSDTDDEEKKYVLTARNATSDVTQIKLSVLDFDDCDCDDNLITIYAFGLL